MSAPTAYIVCGAPAAGKTTYAKELARKERAVFLDIDTSTERLVRLALDLSGQNSDDRDSPWFKERFREPIYEQLFDIARENLEHASVVIAGPFTKELQDPRWCDKLAARLGAPVEVHYLRCPPEIRKERMLRRRNPRDEAKLRNWDEYLRYYGDEAPPLCPHLLVDTG